MATRRTFLGLAVSVLASQAYADQRIVVTGHLGNIGQRIADKLGTPFVGIDKKNGRLQDLSYRDRDSEWPVMLNGARAVVHLAATANPFADKDDIYRNNIVATWNLLQASREGCRDSCSRVRSGRIGSTMGTQKEAGRRMRAQSSRTRAC
jgi:NAD dependent epimerase/dehydratase family